MRPIITLLGPTASGKTSLSLALADRLAALGRPVEIVTLDSAQVYRGMDIGTAKPDAATRARVPHHLIDLVDPSEPYSAARFRADALAAIEAIRARGREPLLVGGTMLYFKALREGLNAMPSADPALRARLEAEAAAHGWPHLHARLAQRDPVTAARLHPNDKQRVQRALEVVELTGRPLSEWHGEGTEGSRHTFVKFALSPPDRAVLHARIALRLRLMMEAGFLDEVARLHARGDLHPDLPSIRSVGYRQLWGHLDGAYGLAEAEAKALAATRQFAKRQLTWLKSEHDLCWIDPEAPDTVERVLERA
ncbi:MAG TPA: tRNA (adenosine(37)-N6)-dimethylallyltransferase MiaA [Nevskiaceae bacterium]|nr:tRNA (adenosine(37)-N6)-dimethylallyltransferase MiaA [Nevskiaceae bacterium]